MTVGQIIADLDLDRIEREIGDIVAKVEPIDYAPPQYREKLPDYVAHAPGVPQIGALSAAAVVRMYEEAAAAIAAMGEEQKRVVERCEDIIAGAQAAMEDCKLVAEQYREEAKKTFETIESQARLTAEVTQICADLRKKIAIDGGPAV